MWHAVCGMAACSVQCKQCVAILALSWLLLLHLCGISREEACVDGRRLAGLDAADNRRAIRLHRIWVALAVAQRLPWHAVRLQVLLDVQDIVIFVTP